MLDLGHIGLDAALRTTLLLVLAVWAAWWVLGLLVAVVDPRLAARLGPPMLRALIVGGVAAATVAPAHAANGSAGALDGLPLPERPLTPEPSKPAAPPPAEGHVVAPGDTLWAIVRDHSPAASDAQVARGVARWHAANRDAIGPDPDLIRPGQHLYPPGAS